MTSSTQAGHQASNPPNPVGEERAERHLRVRLQRLRIVLLVVLGLWFLDSDLADVSAPTPPSAEVSPDRAQGLDQAQVPWQAVRVEELSALLQNVNPLLDPTEVDRIARAVIRYSAKYELAPELVTAVLLVESSARPWVQSPKGAVGLMQVMPHMMAPLGLAGNAATIESNIEAGCWILAENIRRLGEDAGISSYFWGSDIRGLAYLERVRAAREEINRYRS